MDLRHQWHTGRADPVARGRGHSGQLRGLLYDFRRRGTGRFPSETTNGRARAEASSSECHTVIPRGAPGPRRGELRGVYVVSMCTPPSRPTTASLSCASASLWWGCAANCAARSSRAARTAIRPPTGRCFPPIQTCAICSICSTKCCAASRPRPVPSCPARPRAPPVSTLPVRASHCRMPRRPGAARTGRRSVLGGAVSWHWAAA